MLEFSIARKYLTPRWRQLSVSIISLISILVIALVVWLIVVFFSVTYGLEKSWINKLIALTAPVRITPTDAYYHSYYYQVDAISSKADYSAKTIGEKLTAHTTDPYDPMVDEEPPRTWPKPDKGKNGEVKDLVKLAFTAIASVKDVSGLTASDYEMTMGNIRLQLLRNNTAATIQQASYLGSFDQNNPRLSKALVPLSMADLSNLYHLIGVPLETDEENQGQRAPLSKETIQQQLVNFFALVDIKELKSITPFWTFPKGLWPTKGSFQGFLLTKNGFPQRVLIPKGKIKLAEVYDLFPEHKVDPIQLEFRNKVPYLSGENLAEQKVAFPISLIGDLSFPVKLVVPSIEKASRASSVLFETSFVLQGIPLKGKIPYRTLQIEKAFVKNSFATPPENSPEWLYQVKEHGETKMVLPTNSFIGEGVLLPRPFKEAGVLVGDRGYLSYVTPTTSSLQEQRIPISVAGFYDPGIIPIGGKYILANKEVTGLIRSSQNQEDTTLSNGINVRFANLDQAEEVKKQLQTAFNEAGIAPYWRIETYREYDFTKDLIQQLKSEKNLFSLLAIIIIIVACSNIISMLIILVNDKKAEIGILRSMGASTWTISLIFGWCGIVMGYLGSLIGTAAAIITLKNLDPIIAFLSRIQGFDMFNPIFYGEKLPADLSLETLGVVILATTVISCLAGLIPAFKASLLRPSAILRSE